MELNHLKYFYQVVKSGGFTKASEILRVQQPTISKMVRHLEDELGMPLLERRKVGIRTTKLGAQVFEQCQEVFEKLEDIQNLAQSETQECHGPLAFGVTDSVCAYIMPRVLSPFQKDHPKVSPSIFSGTSNFICRELASGHAEFGLFFSIPDPNYFEFEEISSVPFELVGSPRVVENRDIRHSFIIAREVDYPRSRPYPVFQMLEKQHLKIHTKISVNNLDSQKELAKEGLGVAMLPRFMVKSSFQRKSLVPVYPNKKFSYSLKVAKKRGKILSKNATTFLDYFRRIGPKFME